jgi:hypothetical protein
VAAMRPASIDSRLHKQEVGKPKVSGAVRGGASIDGGSRKQEACRRRAAHERYHQHWRWVV